MKAPLFCTLLAYGATVGAASPDLVRDDYRITAAPGLHLAVRNVHRADRAPGGRPVILLHGARVPGIASFDLPVPGGSAAADLAAASHDVFILDARGYGGSSRPGQSGARTGQPLVNSFEVVQDIAATVDHVRQRTGADQVALIGWATGAHWSGMYASLHPDRVSHLVLYNTLYGGHRGHPRLGPGSALEDPEHPGRFDVANFGAYRFNTAASLTPSWDRSIPCEDPSRWRDPAVVAAYQKAAIASDPSASERTPPSFRAPSGALEDSYYLASGRQLWDAAPITGRVLILRSGNDFWSRPEDVASLQEHLVNARTVRAVTIPDATHFVHLDRAARGRRTWLEEVTAFLRSGQAT